MFTKVAGQCVLPWEALWWLSTVSAVTQHWLCALLSPQLPFSSQEQSFTIFLIFVKFREISPVLLHTVLLSIRGVCVCVRGRTHMCSVVSSLCYPMDCSLPGFCVQQEYWSGLPFPPPGGLPNPRIEPASPMPPALGDRLFTREPPGSQLSSVSSVLHIKAASTCSSLLDVCPKSCSAIAHRALCRPSSSPRAHLLSTDFYFGLLYFGLHFYFWASKVLLRELTFSSSS